jgi:hypothetical protein
VRGLDGAVVDADVMKLAALEVSDMRVVDVRVAGPAALLVAKVHKLDDRKDSDRQSDKDALDVLRLLREGALERRTAGQSRRSRSRTSAPAATDRRPRGRRIHQTRRVGPGPSAVDPVRQGRAAATPSTPGVRPLVAQPMEIAIAQSISGASQHGHRLAHR